MRETPLPPLQTSMVEGFRRQGKAFFCNFTFSAIGGIGGDIVVVAVVVTAFVRVAVVIVVGWRWWW